MLVYENIGNMTHKDYQKRGNGTLSIKDMNTIVLLDKYKKVILEMDVSEINSGYWIFQPNDNLTESRIVHER